LKRDLDLLRNLLLELEKGPEASAAGSAWESFTQAGHELATIHYHVQLLNDAGLIVADELVPGQWWPERITWAGHEFLDSARDDATWEEALRRVEAGSGAAPFEVVHKLLVGMVTESVAQKPSARPRRKK
jgi:hypothetical protein